MSTRSAPAQRAMAWPSAVYSQELELTSQHRPIPPVARTIARARKRTNRAGLPPVAEAAGDPVAVLQERR